MRIEVQVPVDTDPMKFDDLMQEAAKKHGYILHRRSNMPIDFHATIVEPNENFSGSTRPYLTLSAELYQLKKGETA
jgi:hypothetical protein